MKVYNTSGYPKKYIIRKMLKDANVDVEKVVFNAEYSKRGAGILWKAHSIDQSIKEWITIVQDQGIEILCSNFDRRIHSVWFKKKV